MTSTSMPDWNNKRACLDHALLDLSGNIWTIGDAVEGVQIFGGTGSGKTRGSGWAIAQSFIKAGFGGLVLTAKPDELITWTEYLRSTGLGDDEIANRLVVVRPPGSWHPSAVMPQRRDSVQPLPLRCSHGLNILEYEWKATGGLTHDLVSLLTNALNTGGPMASRSEPYWDDALREMLTHAIDLVVWGTAALHGNARIQLQDIDQVIRTAPQTLSQASSQSWRNAATSKCWAFLEAIQQRYPSVELLAQARQRALESVDSSIASTVPDPQDFSHTLDYWLHDFPGLSDKTRSIIVSTFTSKVAGLSRSPLRELLGADDLGTSCAPHVCPHSGTILILYLPVKLYGEVGRFAQVLLKLIWQRAMERRAKELDAGKTPVRPVFLWSDESQHFLTKEDALFQQTARSSLCSTVYLTQNISNYYAVLGGDHTHAAADSLLGNLQTRIFHANGDPATNEWAGRLFGSWFIHNSSLEFLTNKPQSFNVEDKPLLFASHFASLRKGGWNGQVQCVIFQAGQTWSEQSRQQTKTWIESVTGRQLKLAAPPPHILFHTFAPQGIGEGAPGLSTLT